MLIRNICNMDLERHGKKRAALLAAFVVIVLFMVVQHRNTTEKKYSLSYLLQVVPISRDTAEKLKSVPLQIDPLDNSIHDGKQHLRKSGIVTKDEETASEMTKDILFLKQKNIDVQLINPQTLLLGSRFDIIVKTVYAIFLSKGTMPRFTKKMYLSHIFVWNHFKEPCEFTGDSDWFDRKNPCVAKNTGDDFENAFKKTFEFIQHDGFDVKKSLVPITKKYFPLNGAHRIAAVIALNIDKFPVQMVRNSNLYNWDYNFFLQKGFQRKYADFAVLQWMLHVKRMRTVIFWPEAASNSIKMKTARNMVKDDCGDIIYHKTITINQNGLESLVLHAYGKEGWLNAKIEQLRNNKVGNPFPITIFYVNPHTGKSLNECKQKLRSFFALKHIKSSVHIPDYHQEAKIISQMSLNENSLFYLNHHKGSNCGDVSNEIAHRLKLPTVNPSMYLLPQGIMVDSGAAMSFFGIRKRTDVDLLFHNKLKKSLLGNHNGILIEDHAFAHNRIGTRRAWGQEHLTEECSVDDLFVDPFFYGYCHGLKFVSLEELILYKTRRGERGKDDKDVFTIRIFLEKHDRSSELSVTYKNRI